MTTKRKRCKAAVYKRDTYRRTGRGKSGFEMHYTKAQCSRAAVGDDFCSIHAKIAARRGGDTERAEYFQFMMAAAK